MLPAEMNQANSLSSSSSSSHKQGSFLPALSLVPFILHFCAFSGRFCIYNATPEVVLSNDVLYRENTGAR